jgi:uncharacterized protein (DUF1501 family)
MTIAFVEPDTEEGPVVVVFLRGGADGLSLVPPTRDDDYHRERPRLAVAPREALRLDGLFGLHPALRGLDRLFEEGVLTVVPACGSDDDTRSHFEAQDLMEQGGRSQGGGWLGRFLRRDREPWPTQGQSDPSEDRAGGALTAVAFGATLPLSLLGAPGAVALRSIDELRLGESQRPLAAPLARLYDGDPLLGPSAREALRALDTVERLRAEPYRPAAGACYGDDDFSGGLRLVAQLVKSSLGLRAACVDLPGWDSHALQSQVMEPLMRSLATGLTAFAADLGPRLARTSVVVMTEFGRRVGENSALGTDHGRGSALFVMGGGTRGGVRGAWPGLDPGRLEGPGDVRVATDYRDVLASVLARHGATAGAVFPGRAANPTLA